MATRCDRHAGHERRHRNAATAQRSAAHRAEPLRGSTGSVVRASRRPAVTAGIGLAVVATTAAGYQASDGHQPGQAGFTVSAEAIEQANELADTQIENDARLASALAAQANVEHGPPPSEKGRRDQLPPRRPSAKARKAGRRAGRPAPRSARPCQKQRQAVIARRAGRPQGRRPRCCCRLRLGRGPVRLPRLALDERERLEHKADEPLLGCLRHPAVAARLQDGHRRPRLARPTRPPRSSGAWSYIQERYGTPVQRPRASMVDAAPPHCSTRRPVGAASRCRRRPTPPGAGHRQHVERRVELLLGEVTRPRRGPRVDDHVADGAPLLDRLLGHGGRGLVADVAVQRGDDGRRALGQVAGSAPRRPSMPSMQRSASSRAA